MNAAIYLRVSTEKQDAEVQLPALVRLCEARGWSAPVFQETASGAKERPELDRLCEAARRGTYQVIVVWALDRLGRDLWEIIARVRALWAAGVRIVALNDSWTEGADGPVRELLLFVFAWVANFERQRLRERTRAGLAAAKAKGRKGGRPKAPADSVAGAVAEVRAGKSVEAARRAWCVSEGTLRRALKAAGVMPPNGSYKKRRAW